MNRRTDLFLLFLVPVLWGINFVMIKFSIDHGPPLVVLTIRYVLTILVLGYWLKNLPKLKEWRMAIASGLIFGVVYFALFFTGARLIPASESVILTQLQVPLSALIAARMYHERVPARTIIGIVIAFIGMAITAGMPTRIGEIDGVILVTISGAVWALANNTMKAVKSIDATTFNALIATVAVIPMLVLSLIFEPYGWRTFFDHLTLKEIGALLYMVLISTGIGYYIWITMLKRHPVSFVAPFNLLVPIIGIIGTTVLLKEPLTAHTVTGAVVCLLGLALIVLKRS